MVALKVICFILGVAFALFGYFIFFKKKYFLINGFDEAFKAGLKNEDYAKRVGLIEFIIGILILFVAVALVVFV